MLYHLIKSSGEYILWITDDAFTKGLLISRWSHSIKKAVNPEALSTDNDSDNLDWISSNDIILKSTTPINWTMLAQHHPELLV